MKRGLLSGRSDSAALWLFCGLSAVIHLVALGAWVVVTQASQPQIDLDKAVIKTKLVKLGKKRDERLMPRLVRKPPPKPAPKKPAPPKPTPKKPPPKPAQKPPPPKPQPQRSAKDILNAFKEDNGEPDPRPNLSDLIKKAVPDEEGHEEGSRFGEELSGKLKASYNDRLIAKIRSHHTAPNTLTDQERIQLKARVFLRIDADGQVHDVRITKSSGNAAFDNSALSAVKRSAPLPPPPLAVRAFYLRGVSVNLCPSSCS